MRTRFARLWRRNLAFFRLAIITNLEYRLNYFTDAILQPALAVVIELTLWLAVFRTLQTDTLGGFTRADYFSYVIWAPFVSRITSNWMYEFRMVDEIDSGSINGLLVRPMSYFEYYLSQFYGYKFITTIVSMVVLVTVVSFFDLPLHLDRLPLALLLVFYYVFFVFLMSFIVATLAFHLTKTSSLTAAKNLGLWLLSGELVPLDLLPSALKKVLILLPFASSVYIPVGYIAGRVDRSLILQGFASTTVGILILGIVAFVLWRMGLRKYVGTGA